MSKRSLGPGQPRHCVECGRGFRLRSALPTGGLAGYCPTCLEDLFDRDYDRDPDTEDND